MWPLGCLNRTNRSIQHSTALDRHHSIYEVMPSHRSEVEDPDMGLSRNPSCRTLRVPTYEVMPPRSSAVEDPDMGPCRNRSCRTLRVPTHEVMPSCRSAVEDPDMGLSRNPSCRTLRVPTYEMTFLTYFKLQRAVSIGSEGQDSSLRSRCLRNAREHENPIPGSQARQALVFIVLKPKKTTSL
jgi:hypothetical protein